MERKNNQSLKKKLLGIATVAIAVGTMGINSSSANSSEASATNNIVTFALRDFGLGAKIGYNWSGQPRLMIDKINPVEYWPTCSILPPENDEYSCYFLIPEAKDWSKFAPIIAVPGSDGAIIVDESARWNILPNGLIARNTELHQLYLPIIRK